MEEHRQQPQRLTTLDINLTNERQSNRNSGKRKNELYMEYQEEPETLKQFDKMFIDLPWNINTNTLHEEDEMQQLNSVEVPILPQPISQLHTRTTNDQECLMTDMKNEIEKIPNYLTKRNKSFQQMTRHIQSVITTGAATNSTQELKNVSILMYKIMVIQTYHLLWTAYLKSGIGQLLDPSVEQTIYPTNVKIWPKQVKTMVQLTNNTNANEIYSNFVDNQLIKLEHELKQYKTELNMRANNFHGYTLTIQQIIDTYIEQHLQAFRTKIEHQIELIHYDYHIQALKLEYFRYNPNKYQKQVMKRICRSKYEQETTEQEYNFLKQQLNYFNSPSQSFERSPIAQSALIASIENIDIRQQLLNQYKAITEQARNNLFNIYMKSAEEQREEYRKKYEDSVQKMRSDQQTLDENQKLPLIMMQLIDQRCTKISERIKCVYTLKAQSTLP